MLREYLVSEAMVALGVPTTRTLAAVTTGETVYRETALPGAVHGNAMSFIGNRLHNVSGKMENGGLPDQMAPATADHSVMEMSATAGRTN